MTDWVFEGSVEVMRIVLDAEEARIERGTARTTASR